MDGPRATYQDAIERLNGKSLRNSLEVCTLFSCLEFMGGAEGPVFPLLNNEKVRLLAEAIVKSKAAWYKEKAIGPRDLRTLLNGCNSALDDPRLGEEVRSGGERGQMLFQLQRFFSRMTYMQIRPQQNPAIATGQFFAVAEMLPGNCSGEFPDSLQAMAAELPGAISGSLGTTIKALLLTHNTVMQYLARLGALSLEGLPRKQGTVSDQAALLGSILERLKPPLDYFRLVPERLGQVFGRDMSAELERYGAVFSRSIREHRQVLQDRPYQVGREGLRLSSWDRYPLVNGVSARSWYAPNMRLLAQLPRWP